MKRLINFIKTRWEEILILGVFLQLFVWTLTTGNLLIILAVSTSAILLVVLVYIAVERVGHRKTQKVRGESTAFTIPRRGLIFTIGKQTDTVAFALENQKPDFIGLLCTDVSEPFADDLITTFSYDSEHVRKRIVNPYDIRETHQISNLLIDWMLEQKLGSHEIAVDVTGGLTTLSVGVFSAADDRRIDSQYIRSKYDSQNRVIPNTMEGVFITRFLGS
jgi:hypothetical protein